MLVTYQGYFRERFVEGLPLALAEDCYNLMLKASTVLLTRSPPDNRFYILWPEHREFELEDRESVVLLDGDRMYMEKWYEEPDYRDEVLVRNVQMGKVLERMPGSIWLYAQRSEMASGVRRCCFPCGWRLCCKHL